MFSCTVFCKTIQERQSIVTVMTPQQQIFFDRLIMVKPSFFTLHGSRMTDSSPLTVRAHLLSFIALLIYFGVIAIVLRYPTSIHPDAVPLDPNFPLHALAAQDLVSGGTPFVNTHLEWPDGAPIRYLAWPLLLIGMLGNLIWDPIPAMNIAIIVWLMIQGIGMTYLFQSLLQDWIRATLASTLAISAPQLLIALGNAQFENVAPLFLLLIAWSLLRKKYAWLTVGLLGACFSSPYMGFLGLLLALILGYKQSWTWFNMVVTSSAVWWYYHAVSDGMVHESTQPAPSIMSESASLLGLWMPANIAENGGNTLTYGVDRLNQIGNIIPTDTFDDSWFWVMVTASSYIGITWTFIGLAGLWMKRHDPIVKGLSIWGLIALLFSFGDVLYINTDLQLHWIWQLSNWIPGLSNMNATYRFLAAPSLLLALGVVCFGSRWMVILSSLLCLGEALLITPAHWPIPAKNPDIPAEIKDLDQPFVFWPPPPVISSYKVTMTGLLLNQPVALFSEQGVGLPKADGRLPQLGAGLNRRGNSLQQWVDQLVDLKVNRIVFYQSFHDNYNRIPIRVHQRKCYDSYCISLLVQPKEDY